MSCKVLQPWASPLLLLLLLLTGFPQPLPRDHLMPLQVRRMRCCVPRRVSAENSAVSSLRSPRAAPQEAVLLLVGRRRRLLPAVPGHLRDPQMRWSGSGQDGTLRWTKHLFQLRRVGVIRDGAAGAPSGLCSRVYPPTGWRAAAAGCRDWIQTSIRFYHFTRFLVPPPQQADNRENFTTFIYGKFSSLLLSFCCKVPVRY